MVDDADRCRLERYVQSELILPRNVENTILQQASRLACGIRFDSQRCNYSEIFLRVARPLEFSHSQDPARTLSHGSARRRRNTRWPKKTERWRGPLRRLCDPATVGGWCFPGYFAKRGRKRARFAEAHIESDFGDRQFACC